MWELLFTVFQPMMIKMAAIAARDGLINNHTVLSTLTLLTSALTVLPSALTLVPSARPEQPTPLQPVPVHREVPTGRYGPQLTHALGCL